MTLLTLLPTMAAATVGSMAFGLSKMTHCNKIADQDNSCPFHHFRVRFPGSHP